VAKKLTTGNRFYKTTDERDDALRSTFGIINPHRV